MVNWCQGNRNQIKPIWSSPTEQRMQQKLQKSNPPYNLIYQNTQCITFSLLPIGMLRWRPVQATMYSTPLWSIQIPSVYCKNFQEQTHELQNWTIEGGLPRLIRNFLIYIMWVAGCICVAYTGEEMAQECTGMERERGKTLVLVFM